MTISPDEQFVADCPNCSARVTAADGIEDEPAAIMNYRCRVCGHILSYLCEYLTPPVDLYIVRIAWKGEAATAQRVAAARTLFPGFAQLPVREVLQRLQSSGEVCIGDLHERAAAELARRAQEQQFVATMERQAGSEGQVD